MFEGENARLARISAWVCFIKATWYGCSFAIAVVSGNSQSSASGADPLHTKWNRDRMTLAAWNARSRKGMLENLDYGFRISRVFTILTDAESTHRQGMEHGMERRMPG